MVRRKRLTNAQVNALPIRFDKKTGEPVRYFQLDHELRGHYIRVLPSGTRTFLCVARDPNGKQKWFTIGGCDLWKIEDSREKARTVIKRIEDGKPPEEPKPEQPDSYKAVAENWIKVYVVEDKKLITRAEIERTLKKYIYPKFGERNFVDIRRADVAALLDKIATDSGPYMANNTLAVMSSIANWHAGRDETYTPTAYSKTLRRRTEPRDRVLSHDEIRTLWKQAGYSGSYGALIKLLLLTGQRLAKVQHMRWADISIDGVWSIPRDSSREKGTGGTLTLPPLALEIVKSQSKIAGNAYVFASDRTANPIVGVGKLQKEFQEACALKQSWRPHDLRRTARTLMGDAGIEPHIAERVVGHVVGSAVQRIYDRGTYDQPKAHALASLADLIARIVGITPPNVVRLRKKAAR